MPNHITYLGFQNFVLDKAMSPLPTLSTQLPYVQLNRTIQFYPQSPCFPISKPQFVHLPCNQSSLPSTFIKLLSIFKVCCNVII